jgi:hypothetical protein
MPPEAKIGRKSSRLVAALATVAIFAGLFWRIPFDRFWAALEGAKIAPFVAVMASFSLVYFLVDTLVVTLLLRWFHGSARYRDLLPARAVTYLVSIVNTQLAQAALALYLQRRYGLPLARLAGTIALLALLEVTQLVLFATVGWLSLGDAAPAGIGLVPLAWAGLWAVLLFVARSRSEALPAWIRGTPLLETFRELRAVHVAAVLALKAGVFLTSILAHRTALRFFGIDIPALELLACLPIVYVVAALPITVAHLGTSQAAWIYFFADRAPEASLLAYSLAAHLTFMLANGALGILFLPLAWRDLFGDRARLEPGTAASG